MSPVRGYLTWWVRRAATPPVRAEKSAKALPPPAAYIEKPPEAGDAERLYEHFCRELQTLGVKVSTGVFAAVMEVELVNSGPVTFIIDRVRDGNR